MPPYAAYAITRRAEVLALLLKANVFFDDLLFFFTLTAFFPKSVAAFAYLPSLAYYRPFLLMPARYFLFRYFMQDIC